VIYSSNIIRLLGESHERREGSRVKDAPPAKWQVAALPLLVELNLILTRFLTLTLSEGAPCSARAAGERGDLRTFLPELSVV
jgi:hypothetical protein